MMIGDEAFAECKRLKVTILDTVKILGENLLRGTESERLELEAKAEAERLKAERLAREKAEAEAKARAEQEKKWTDALIPASSYNDLDSPEKHGYNSPEAFKWLQKNGSIAAIIIMAKCYVNGCCGVSRDLFTALTTLGSLPEYVHNSEKCKSFIKWIDSLLIAEARARRRNGY